MGGLVVVGVRHEVAVGETVEVGVRGEVGNQPAGCVDVGLKAAVEVAVCVFRPAVPPPSAGVTLGTGVFSRAWRVAKRAALSVAEASWRASSPRLSLAGAE